MQTKDKMVQCQIQSHEYTCSQNLSITFHCLRCRKQLVQIRQPLSFILITLSNTYLYFFAYKRPQLEQSSNIIVSDFKVPCLVEPFQGMSAVSVCCGHCGTRLGTTFQQNDKKLPQCLQRKMLLETDSLLQDDQHEGIIEFLIESAKDSLNIKDINIQRSTAKLYDLLQSAKKGLCQFLKLEEQDLSNAEDSQEDTSLSCSSRGSLDKIGQPEIYQSMENQRIAIEAELGLDTLKGINLKAIFKDLIAQQRHKQVQMHKQQSLQQSEEQSQGSQDLYFAQIQPPRNDESTDYVDGFYYCDQKWYEYSGGRMRQTNRLMLYPIQAIDKEQQWIKKELRNQMQAVRLHVQSTLKGEPYVGNEKELMLGSKARQSEKITLSELIEEHNRLIEQQYQSNSSGSQAQVEILEDLNDLQRQQWGLGEEEQVCGDNAEINALDSLQFYEQTDKWIRNRLKVGIAQAQKQCYSTITVDDCQ